MCTTCDDFTKCTTCIATATLVSGTCTCAPKAYDSATNSCTCNSRCTTCSGINNGQCLSCISGLYLDSGLCVSACRTFTESGTTTCTQTSQNLISHLIFDKIGNEIIDTESKYKAVLGYTADLYDAHDPWPIKENGLYFAGASYA